MRAGLQERNLLLVSNCASSRICAVHSVHMALMNLARCSRACKFTLNRCNVGSRRACDEPEELQHRAVVLVLLG
jgi:hypothetical protein